jgi:hypothetical protein
VGSFGIIDSYVVSKERLEKRSYWWEISCLPGHDLLWEKDCGRRTVGKIPNEFSKV